MQQKKATTKRKPGEQRSVRQWDIWLRLSHWLMAILVIAVLISAEVGNFVLHSRLATILTALVLFRILWGICGSENARLNHLFASPKQLWQHIRNLPNRKPSTYKIHTPLGGIVAVLFLVLIALQAFSSLFIRTRSGEYVGTLFDNVNRGTARAFSALHHDIGHVVQFLAILHITAAVYYLLWKRQNLIWTMVTGTRPAMAGDDKDAVFGSGKTAITILFLSILFFLMLMLVQNS